MLWSTPACCQRNEQHSSSAATAPTWFSLHSYVTRRPASLLGGTQCIMWFSIPSSGVSPPGSIRFPLTCMASCKPRPLAFCGQLCIGRQWPPVHSQLLYHHPECARHLWLLKHPRGIGCMLETAPWGRERERGGERAQVLLSHGSGSLD